MYITLIYNIWNIRYFISYRCVSSNLVLIVMPIINIVHCLIYLM